MGRNLNAGDVDVKQGHQTKECPHCRKTINANSRICPLCAGRIRDPQILQSATCPRCTVTLGTHVTPDGEQYDLCPQCHGLWLDRDEFHRATRTKTGDRQTEEYVRGPLRDPPTYISCVRCGTTMNRKNFGRISGVIVDECGDHGIWLDAGELQKIQHFIADGGLETAQDREVEQIRTELREVAAKLSQVSFTQKLIHFWNPKRWLFTGFR
ncbi:MAG TPA: zf-TFIIB domain-containing protein [Nitrospiraceae bacterium]|nr:zf-TFIIB domain-containing protein [Nitrospiraceae bacterium]